MRLGLSAIVLLCVGSSCLYSQALDTLTGSFSSFSGTPKALRHLDSIQNAANASFNKLQLSYDSINSLANKASTRIQQRIDSLNQLNLPPTTWPHALDSVNQWKYNQLNALQSKVDDIKGKVNEEIEPLNLPGELSAKASDFMKAVDKFDPSIPESTLRDFDFGNDSSLDLPGVENPLSTLPGIENPISDLPNLNDIDIQSIELGEVSDEIKSIQENIPENLPTNIEDVSSSMEKQMSEAVQLEDVQKQMGEVDQLKEMAGQLNDEEAVREKLEEEIQQQAVDHFAGKEQVLEQAMETLSKYKKKYESVQSISDLPKKMPNAMHGKPFVERLVPGIVIQIHRKESWLFDFNPYIGYRVSGRLTAGLGWNQRVAYNFDENEFHSEMRIFGPRTYGEFSVAKGFSARLELEYMKTLVPSQFSSGNTDEKGMEWVFGSMVGLKKEYNFIKGVKGTVMLMYNIYDPHHRSPYGDKLNMRFGFEFPVKRRNTN